MHALKSKRKKSEENIPLTDLFIQLIQPLISEGFISLKSKQGGFHGF